MICIQTSVYPANRKKRFAWHESTTTIKIDCEQSLFCSKIRGEKVAEHESRASGVAREAGDERKERLQWFHTTIVKLFDSSCLSQLRPFFNMIP